MFNRRKTVTEIIPVEPQSATTPATASEETAYLSSTLSHCAVESNDKPNDVVVKLLEKDFLTAKT